MKMVVAIIRPNSVASVSDGLEAAGYLALTKWGVTGRGKQRGIQIGDVIYDEIAKTSLMVVCEDEAKKEVIDIIMKYAITGENGNIGDGKIFVLPVEESYTIRTQSQDKELVPTEVPTEVPVEAPTDILTDEVLMKEE